MTAAIFSPAATTRAAPTPPAANEDQNTTDYEDRLRQRIESIVASVVGAGHVRVQVAADMNYNHTSTTSESYDPDSKVVRSTQTVEQNAMRRHRQRRRPRFRWPMRCRAPPASGGNDAGKSTSGRTEETTNYEISKKVTTSSQDGGDVKRLSVAVVVDGTAPATTATAYKPRTAAEMAQITSLVKSAMGFEPARGDQVQVTNMEFARVDAGDAHARAQAAAGPGSPPIGSRSSKPRSCALTALLIGLFVARPLIARMFAPNGRPAAPTAIAGACAGGRRAAGARPPPPKAAHGARLAAARAPARSTSAASKDRCANPPSKGR